jgi:hypothetical protein
VIKFGSKRIGIDSQIANAQRLKEQTEGLQVID